MLAFSSRLCFKLWRICLDAGVAWECHVTWSWNIDFSWKLSLVLNFHYRGFRAFMDVTLALSVASKFEPLLHLCCLLVLHFHGCNAGTVSGLWVWMILPCLLWLCCCWISCFLLVLCLHGRHTGTVSGSVAMARLSPASVMVHLIIVSQAIVFGLACRC